MNNDIASVWLSVGIKKLDTAQIEVFCVEINEWLRLHNDDSQLQKKHKLTVSIAVQWNKLYNS